MSLVGVKKEVFAKIKFKLINTYFCLLRVATSNGLIDSKGQTVLTTSGKATHFMSPLGPIQLTAEECNEILMKRAAAAVAANNQQHTLTTADGHHSISVQVQKVIQGLEDDNDSQTTTHLKIEPPLEISPKIEQIDVSAFYFKWSECLIFNLFYFSN